MKKQIETNRLILREITSEDASTLFEMDSNPVVLKYLNLPPVSSIEEVYKKINVLKKTYSENKLARWAVTDKKTGEVLGWCGLKLIEETINGHCNYYDLGYRFLPQHWGKGYATESAKAWVQYAFNELKVNELFAITDINHEGSKNVLRKLGFSFINRFEYPHEPWIGDPTDWFALKKEHS